MKKVITSTLLTVTLLTGCTLPWDKLTEEKITEMMGNTYASFCPRNSDDYQKIEEYVFDEGERGYYDKHGKSFYDFTAGELDDYLENGGDPNLKIQWGEKSYLYLSHAAIMDERMMETLVKHGVDVNQKDDSGKTLLHKVYNFETAKLLILKGADVNAEDEDGRTPLEKAVSHTLSETEYFPVESTYHRDAPKIEKPAYDPIGKACEGPRSYKEPIYTEQNRIMMEEIVELLIENGAEVKDNALCNLNNPRVVQLLVDNGADVNASCHPLNDVNNYEGAKILIENGANINEKDINGKTPLHNETKSFNNTNNTDELVKKIKLLIENGADVNIEDNYGKAPIFYALNEPEILKLLIDAGANVNAKDGQGKTPIQAFAGDNDHECLIGEGYESGQSEVVRLLVEAGADITVKNSIGRDILNSVYYGCMGRIEYVEGSRGKDPTDAEKNFAKHVDEISDILKGAGAVFQE